MISQKTSGDATTPMTRDLVRQNLINSRCHSVKAGSAKLFNGCPRLVYEHVFERRLVQRHRIDRTREGLYYLRNKSMAVVDLDAYFPIHNGWLHTELRFDFCSQS